MVADQIWICCVTVWVGLTGGIGSGKSAAADLFVQLGICVIDADAISRQLTAYQGVALPAIQAAFGEQAVFEQQLNRDYVRDLIFKRPEAKAELEAILHPLILKTILQQQAAVDAVYGLVDIPLLTELPQFRNLVQRVLVIDAPETLQVERVMARNGLSRAQIESIMAQQATRAERMAIADEVILNDGDLHHLELQVLKCHKHYLQTFGTV